MRHGGTTVTRLAPRMGTCKETDRAGTREAHRMLPRKGSWGEPAWGWSSLGSPIALSHHQLEGGISPCAAGQACQPCSCYLLVCPRDPWLHHLPLLPVVNLISLGLFQGAAAGTSP